MTRVRVRMAVAASLLCSALCGSEAQAQDWFLDLGLEQAFSSGAPLHSPRGFSASLGSIAAWGPIGFHASYRDVAEGGHDIITDCTGAPLACDPGTFRVRYEMRSAGLGISYDFINPTDVMLTLAVTGTRNWRYERITHRATGQPYDHEVPTSLGFSASAHLRLRPWMSGMRPEFGVRYDYSGQGACGPEVACWQRHDAFGLSFGFSWVARARRHE